MNKFKIINKHIFILFFNESNHLLICILNASILLLLLVVVAVVVVVEIVVLNTYTKNTIEKHIYICTYTFLIIYLLTLKIYICIFET